MTSNEELDRLLARELEESVKSDMLVPEKLEIIEREYEQYLEKNVDTCQSLERLAIADFRIEDAQHHRIKGQIYKRILDNYIISKRYYSP